MTKCCITLFLIAVFSVHCWALDLSASSAILYEPQTKSVLFEKNAEDRRAIASTTKIMTAVVTIENVDLSDIVEIPKECTGIEGTSIYLKAGEQISVLDLLYGMLLQSGNDAANALANYVSSQKGIEFIALMNEKADVLGMKNTEFKNPSGLPDEGHFSTAYDMAILTAYAMKLPEFYEIVGTESYSAGTRKFINHNKLLRLYSGVNGVKTGYTKSAGRCLVSNAEKNGMSLVAVTLAAPDDWEDHKKMFDYGFSNFQVKEFKNEIFNVAVVGGDVACIKVSSFCNGSLLLKKDSFVEYEVVLPRFIYAPINRGDRIGEIRYIVDGEVVQKFSVVSTENIAYKERKSFLKRFFSF